MASENHFRINLKYLPIKAHYFFLFGGTGGTIPYMQVFGKDFGLSSMAIGLIFTLVPLCVLISKPAFGCITDKFRDVRLILIILVIVTGIAFFSVLYVPPIRKNKGANINITAACDKQKDELEIYFLNYDSSCDRKIEKSQYECEFSSHYCLKNISLNVTLNVTDSLPNNGTGSLAFSYKFYRRNISTHYCDCLEENLSTIVCEPKFYRCNSFDTKISEYKLYNFWIFAFLTIIGQTASTTMWCLTDAACSEILEGNSKDYGKQRLWGTVSWGITALSSGYLNDIASLGSKYRDFSSGFYWMLICFAVDIVILCLHPLKKAQESLHICKDVKKVFSTFKTVIFAIGVYITGACFGLLWTYLFWFLTDLGSSQLLLGLVAGVQCFLAEVPFFFFSGCLVKNIGHFYCLIMALLAFSLRMGIYSILHNPWWILPVELLHGVTFAVFFGAMTLYAIDYAPPGTEATMLGIFGGIFEGLGLATGSLLGGLGFSRKGGRWTFFTASMISLSSVPILTILNIFLSETEDMTEAL